MLCAMSITFMHCQHKKITCSYLHFFFVADNQQYPVHMNLIQQQQQPQYTTTPGGLMTANPPMMLVQGGVGAGGVLSQLQMAGVLPQQLPQPMTQTPGTSRLIENRNGHPQG